MRKISLLVVVCCLVIVGCSGGQEVETASGGTASGNAASPNENAPRPDGGGGQAVVNDPSQIKNADTSQGVVVKPANPDDPKFKADPRLGGGN